MAKKKNYEVFWTATGQPVEDDDDVLRDGQTLRTSLMMNDGMSEMQRSVADAKAQRLVEDSIAKHFGHSDALALHRPGQRFAVDAVAVGERERIYQDEKRMLQEAWRTPVADVRGQQPGDQCTINGAPGHLNHRLQCVPDKRQDAVPRTMDAAEGQRVKDQAYAEMCRDLEQAWKR